MALIYRVLYDFVAEEEGELSVTTGDVVKHFDAGDDGSDTKNGWIFVHATKNKDKGYVPIDYLEQSRSASSKPAYIPPTTLQQPVTTIQQESQNPDTATDKMNLSALSSVGKTKSTNSTSLPNAAPFASPSTKSEVDSATTPKTGGKMTLFSAASKASSSATGNGNSTIVNQPPPSPYDHYGSSSTSVGDKAMSAAALATSFGANTNMSTAPPSQSKGTGGGVNKFKNAAKSVQNMVRVTNTVAPPRVPSLSAAVEREDFDELVKRNDEYFARLLSSQAETFESLTDMVDALSKKLQESTQCSNDLVGRLTELDDLIDEEKRKWKQQNEAEKNANVLVRSKELTAKNQ